jgi:hypothetical protein
VGGPRKKLIEAAGLILSGSPDESTMLGALAAQIDNVQDLWADNVATVNCFVDMLTQWNVGPGGVVGLRYEVLPLVMRQQRLAAADRAEVWQGVRVMERAALKHFGEQRGH